MDVYFHFEKNDGSIQTTILPKDKAESMIEKHNIENPDKVCYMSADQDGEEVLL